MHGKGGSGGAAASAFLSFGFRPFFLFGAAYGALAMLVWLAAFAGMFDPPGALAPSAAHAHEMLFGFAAAVLAGFLLTAVAAWTGQPPVQGRPLVALVAVWAAGRVAFWLAGSLPAIVVAVVDLAFLPALAVAVARRIVAARQVRNAPFPVLLAVLFGANLLVHLEALGASAGTAFVGLRLAVYVFAFLIAAVGGRIIPAFTTNALKRRGEAVAATTLPGTDALALGGLALTAIVDLAGGGGIAPGALAAATAVALGLRMVRWQTPRTLRDPLLAILHLGHGWLVVGFAVKAAAELGAAIAESTAFHALTTGAIGTMVLAMITRVALGHTGRPLAASPATVAAYGLITIAGALRVVAAALAPAWSDVWIPASGLAWAAAFALYVGVYAPILVGPRAGAGMDVPPPASA